MISTHKKEETTVGKETYDLVKGDFTLEEAKEIINDLFSKKINFNEVKSFSQFVRKGAKDPDTLKRIDELKQACEDAQKLIGQAENEGKTLRVESTISIELL